MVMPICTKCQKDKEITEFYIRNGLPRSQCKMCWSALFRQRYLKNKIKEGEKVCHACKQKKNLQEFSSYCSECKECMRIRQSKYRQANPTTYRLPMKKYEAKIKALNTPVYQRIKLMHRLRSRIRMALKTNSAKKSSSTTILLGCTIPELKIYLESKFTKGMSWERIDNGEIHIDHIRPCSSFDLNDAKQQKECFHYTNLQPLWATDNLKKGNKV